MKKLSLSLLVVGLYLCLALFLGCSGTPQAKGSLIVSSIGEAKTIRPDFSEIKVDSYHIHAVGPDAEVRDIDTKMLPIQLSDMTVGTWVITVDGLDAELAVLATATQSVNIVPAQTSFAVLNLEYISGVGILELTIAWPSASARSISGMDVELVGVDGKLISFSISTSEGVLDPNQSLYSVTKTVADLKSGSYSMTIVGKDYSGQNLDIVLMESVHIYKDKVSKGIVEMDARYLPVACPVITPASTEIKSGQKISITCETDGASIYYTLDGTAPTTESSLYQEPFAVIDNCTVKAIAVRSNLYASAVNTVEYLVTSMDSGLDVELPDFYTMTMTASGKALSGMYSGSMPTVSMVFSPVSDSNMKYAWYLDGSLLLDDAGNVLSVTDTLQVPSQIAQKWHAGTHILTGKAWITGMEYTQNHTFVWSSNPFIGWWREQLNSQLDRCYYFSDDRIMFCDTYDRETGLLYATKKAAPYQFSADEFHMSYTHAGTGEVCVDTLGYVADTNHISLLVSQEGVSFVVNLDKETRTEVPDASLYDVIGYWTAKDGSSQYIILGSVGEYYYRTASSEAGTTGKYKLIGNSIVLDETTSIPYTVTPWRLGELQTLTLGEGDTAIAYKITIIY